ncbi:MAG: DUF2232 domain-containing protein [Alphaproteobacteria bacterium]|nr:DUF2232 domain-containing protein [Alphaproteobacteria bacterium]
MSKNILFAVVAGAASAVAALSFLVGAPGAMMLIYVGPLPLILAGLSLGLKPALIAALTGVTTSGVATGGNGALLYAAGHALPAILIIGLALQRRADPESEGRWYPHGHIVAWLALLAAFALAAAALTLSDGDGFRAAVTAHIEKGLGLLMPQLESTDLDRIGRMMSGLFPGWIAASWVAMAVVNAVIAEVILTRSDRAIRPKPAWGADMTLPDWLSWALVGAAILALFGALIGAGDVGYMGRNLALVLALPYFLLGLAVVHGLAYRTQQPRAILVGFYAILIVSSWALLAVAAIGVLENWIGLRDRLPGGPTKENV